MSIAISNLFSRRPLVLLMVGGAGAGGGTGGGTGAGAGVGAS